MQQKLITMPGRKRIALIAHDNMKQELGDWAQQNLERLRRHRLVATGTTGHLLERNLGIEIDKLISGPLGGDQQIGSMLSDQSIDVVIFFWDPFEPMPHDPDVKALLRVAAVWNVPVACNRSSADFLISSPLMDSAHPYRVPDYEAYIRERTGDSGEAGD
ncbi:methylglyoxal synthase [Marinobacterium nitratireducens]|uniref:Methylglyoxal synthase n=1 Tax=Marinobacterium nitratireducens TaxID=518897 RepID=A0A917ZPL8_9GAMM|nr:methylglyoxal synthase [Marinobacterium nitratireducens]GGO87349.1 methylglyoxal synthase [Marinobacterium nitratireducens]